MLTLTLENYERMEQRAEFDAWLETEGLKDALIVEATFGEGHIDAYCYTRNEAGSLACTPEGLPAIEHRVFRTGSPPPTFVYNSCTDPEERPPR